ncbi:MAG: DUF86 domain-containing protein [Candidatus Nealsonbacteria bacterium]|nr:DUF86 domain-containing protein [Candidatus Nealsonbacteria bacterium]
MYPDDTTRLRHMFDAAKEAVSFVADKQRADLDDDRQLVLALTKCIEIIGEAASRIGEEARDRWPDIPWPQITGMRNRLIHAYYSIDLDILWDTVVTNLPPLIVALARISHGG